MASEKMNPPSYQPITEKEIVLIKKEGVEFRLVSGKFQGETGPAHSNVITATLRMHSNTSIDLDFPASHHVAIYILEGTIEINEEKKAEQHDLIEFTIESGTIKIKSNSNSKLIVLSGLPIDEPIASHGPFVMNYPKEINEAINDYQEGKMGFME